MKTWSIDKPSGAGCWQTRELPEPAPGGGEVVVGVHAVSLNYRDIAVARGVYTRNMPENLIPCSDAAGVVRSVGAGVTQFRPGDRVAGCFMPEWQSGPIDETGARSALGAERNGVLAEQVVFPETGLVRIPEHLTFTEAACLPCAAVTAWNALFETSQLRPGDTVLTLGSGGVSIFALQFARMAGARVIATTGSAAKAERLRAMGAAEVIDYRETPDWDKAVRKLVPEGVDQVIEVGGTGTLTRSLKSVRRGGMVSFIGVVAGAGEVNLALVFMRSIRLQGIFVGSRAMFESMNRAIAASQLRPAVDRVFPFAEANAALAHLESGAHFGKVVIGVRE